MDDPIATFTSHYPNGFTLSIQAAVPARDYGSQDVLESHARHAPQPSGGL